jgi:hypothetical protein
MNTNMISTNIQPLSASYIEDFRLAASQMTGAKKRLFQATIAIKYCMGSARKTETLLGWSKYTVKLGLHEKRTGITCLGGQKARCGNLKWEDKYPEIAKALWELANTHSQQDPTFRTTISYTRLTASAALKHLQNMGFTKDTLPSPGTMAVILNRNGYRLRPVVKAKPLRKIPETDAIFANVKKKDQQNIAKGDVKRLSMDCKATVNIGEYSRGGKTRGYNQAFDHDMGCKEKYTPFGLVDEDSGLLNLFFGNSSKTSDFIVDSVQSWWDASTLEERANCSLIQIKVDNGQESSGRRTQFLKRMVEFADYTGKSIQLLYYPPYHSKYNPIERCWGIMEQHWNGAKLEDVETMLKWAKSMTWKGIHPVVKLSQKVYQKGISLSKKAMEEVEVRLGRNALLPKWDILIHPK